MAPPALQAASLLSDSGSDCSYISGLVLRVEPLGGIELDWLANQPRAALFTTTVTRGAKKILSEDLAGQVLSFDSDAEDMYAEIAASRRTTGQPISQFDAMIAAMARSGGATSPHAT